MLKNFLSSMQKWLGLVSKPSASPTASIQVSDSFILGLDDVSELATLSNENFLNLIQWNSDSQTSKEAGTLENLLGNFPE